VAGEAGRKDRQAETKPAAKDTPYQILFRGNKALSEGALRRAAVDELKDFDRLGQRSSDADDAAFQMELAYRKAGYPFATVDYALERTQETLRLGFTVSEGPRVLIKAVELIDNSAFATKELLAFFEEGGRGFLGQGNRLYVESEVQAAVSGIRNLYYGRGYLDAVVEKPQVVFSEERTRVTITVQIREGTRYLIRGIEFRGNLLPEAQSSLAQLRSELLGKPYFRRRRLAVRSRTLEIYGSLGYPDVSVEVGEVQGEQKGDVLLQADIDTGPLVTIAGIAIEGNARTREELIRRRLRFQTGDRYNLDKQRASFRELYKSGLFTKVDLALERPPGTEAATLVVRVTEAPSKEFYLEPGWGSYEQLRLKVGYKEKNLFGTGRIAGVELNGSIKAQGLTFTLTDPWFLNTDVTADVPVYFRRREEPSFTSKEYGVSFNLSKKLTEHLTTTVGYRFQVTSLSDVNVEDLSESDQNNYNLGSIRGQLTYDTRNDRFFPTSGLRSFFSAERADKLLAGDVTFTRLSAGNRFFFAVTRQTILGLRYRTGLIIPGRGETTVPLGERFFNGGENTVRSFKESELGPRGDSHDPAGGLALNVFSIEVRQRLKGNLVGSIFVDYGNVSPNKTRSEQGKPPYENRSDVLSDTLSEYFQDFRPAVGFGLNYLLPVGPARFDFAFNPVARGDRNEDSFLFHFSVGMAF
jgi:outer membrane protein assembly complex protein YaeT